MAARSVARLSVSRAPGSITRGILRAGSLRVPCALGRSGLSRTKNEGDGATPAGRFSLVAVLYRPDRWQRPQTELPVTAIAPDSGWCDDPADKNYNRAVRLPYPASHERLWRKDRFYDVVVVLDYNLKPTTPGKGSAIFLHIARADFAPTEGCVAIAPAAMRRLLPLFGPGTKIEIR